MLKFYKGKKVLVTGHTGFKGSWLCHLLINAGAEACGYSLPPTTEPSMYELTGLKNLVKERLGDIRDFNDLLGFVDDAKPEIIFHLAAQPIVRLSYSEPLNTFSTNIMGTVNILEAARLISSVKAVVVITTDKVYENKNDGKSFSEDDKLGGHDPYSSSKAAAEIAAASYTSSFDANVATARAGNVIGGGDYSSDRIIPDCVRAAKDGKTIKVRNPHSIRPYQHVLEPLFGYLTLGEKLYLRDKGCSQAFNFGPYKNDCITTKELVGVFCDVWGEKAEWEHKSQENAPYEANYLMLDNKKACEVLDWKPKLSIKEAVEWVVEWEKASDKLGITYAQAERYTAKESRSKS